MKCRFCESKNVRAFVVFAHRGRPEKPQFETASAAIRYAHNKGFADGVVHFYNVCATCGATLLHHTRDFDERFD